jgi:glycosyltransferase involved in cell wall biosynthesis
MEPFASGITTAVCSIIGELPEFTHIVIHGFRNCIDNIDNTKKRFPAGVSFIEWKNADREINLVKDWKAYKELKAILKPYSLKNQKNKFVVHLHSSKAGFIGRFVCRCLGIKSVIYTPHCGAFLRTDINFFKRNLYRFFEWVGGCFGGRVVGCGPSEGELYKNLGKNTTYVSNGVKLKEIKEIKADRNLVSFTGIAWLQKAPALWNAVAKNCFIPARDNGFSFYWIGSGPWENELEKEFITVTGWKSAQEVEALLLKTSIYFSTSAWEGLPYGVLEAMNCGCALLLRNVPGNRELVIPGENGWLFNTKEEAKNKLEVMLKDKTLLAKMGKNSRKLIEQSFSLKQMGDGYRKIYLSY